MEKIIKIALAVLLFVCLLNLPYGYYQLVRFLAMVGFVVLAYQANTKKEQVQFFIFIALALLFQPFLKVSLGRELWNIVDVIVGIYLLISALRENKNG